MRPTEMAHILFSTAPMMADSVVQSNASAANSDFAMKQLAAAIRNIADGLDSLATGQRATYMLLERMQQKMIK